MAMTRKLRMGMVGGGPGAFIGPVHKMAAELDGRIELVAGTFSHSWEKCRQAGETYRLDPERVYETCKGMLAAERARPDGIDFVAVVTPNYLHLPVALDALENGFPVISDKPATATYPEALELEAAAKKAGLPYALTYVYSGYAMVREARALFASGQLGQVRKIVVEYFQGWFTQLLEATGQKQAVWRTDPKQNGPGGCIGDIGVHAFHLLEYVTGQQVTSLNAMLRTVVPGRLLDDDCSAFLRLENGASGILMASQVAAGEGNGLRLRVYGEKGSIDWRQEDPNRLHVKWHEGPEEIRTAGSSTSYLSQDARAVLRLPGGHPEGYIEAFAVLYREFADALLAWREGQANPMPATLPGILAGVRGMRFIERAIESSRSERWVEF
jgi:predicted dehydrogenase